MKIYYGDVIYDEDVERDSEGKFVQIRKPNGKLIVEIDWVEELCSHKAFHEQIFTQYPAIEQRIRLLCGGPSSWNDFFKNNSSRDILHFVRILFRDKELTGMKAYKYGDEYFICACKEVKDNIVSFGKKRDKDTESNFPIPPLVAA